MARQNNHYNKNRNTSAKPDNTRYSAVKTPATVSAQIDKLIERGCIVKDRAFAENMLENINYYRLVHYFAPFLIDKHHYRPGTDFSTVLSIYDFDRRLRNELLNILEEVEISVRAVISNYHALKYGALGYLNPSSFDYSHNHKQFLAKIERAIDQNNDRALVAHHIEKYGGAFPLWVIMELFSFGSLAFFYSDMQECDKREVAETHFGISARHLDNWLMCLADLRNHCAHYNRLYGNGFSVIPKTPPFGEDDIQMTMNTTLFSYIMAMKYVYKRRDNWNWEFVPTLRRLFDEYEMAEISMLGFPPNWEEMLYKK